MSGGGLRIVGAVLALVIHCSAGAQTSLQAAPYLPAVLTALVIDPAVSEISGLAASRRVDDVLWTLNDSDNGNFIYALGSDGHVRQTVEILGASNVDWEDMSAFDLDGKHYLLIADTGDNGGLRKELQIYVVEEPKLDAHQVKRSIDIAWRIRMRWPDGPRDCEAVTVDVRTGDILLLSKKRVPAQLFRIALAKPANADEVRVAEQIASAADIPQPTPSELERDPTLGRYRSQITAMDLDPSGERLVVLNYRDAYLYQRRVGDTWQDALSRPPQSFGLPPIPQGEALSFDRHGRSLYISSERLPAPLLRVDPRP